MDCRHWNCPKMVDWDPLPKIKNFPNLEIFDQIPWTKAHENDQNLRFLKKLCHWKIWKLDGFWPKFIDCNSWNSKIWQKNTKFSQKILWCCRPIVHACLSALQCGKEKNCPTCKRKIQIHTIKVPQKVLISVVVTAQSKVSFVYGPGAVGFLPWWDCCRIYMHPLQHGEGRNLLPECKRLALPYRAPAHRWLGGMVDYFSFSLIKIRNKSRWN